MNIDKRWKQQEDDYLMKYYKNSSYRDLSVALSRSINAVKSRCSALKLCKRKPFVQRKWIKDDIKFLRKNINNYTFDELSSLMNRTAGSIRAKCKDLNIIKSDLKIQKIWSKDDNQYLIDHYYHSSVRQLSEYFNVSEGAIRAKCHDLKLVKKDAWSEFEIEYLKTHYEIMGYEEIANELDRTQAAVSIKAKKLGIHKSPYFCQYDYFEKINTEEKAYWLGFICADGWINQNHTTKSGTVGIELQYGDIDHLKKFNKSINGNYKITDRWRTCSLSNNDKLHHMCCIRIFSKKMYDDLCNLGLTNDKSYTLKFPNISNTLIVPFLRGYFDADGCLSYKNHKLHLNYIGASESMINSIGEQLKYYKIEYRKFSYIDDFDTPMYGLRIYTNKINVKKFLNLIYQDADIYLDRKYKKYQQYLADH